MKEKKHHLDNNSLHCFLETVFSYLFPIFLLSLCHFLLGWFKQTVNQKTHMKKIFPSSYEVMCILVYKFLTFTSQMSVRTSLPSHITVPSKKHLHFFLWGYSSLCSSRFCFHSKNNLAFFYWRGEENNFSCLCVGFPGQ